MDGQDNRRSKLRRLKIQNKDMRFEFLPTEITLEIALRLPTRSFLLLKCTCKFFYRILSDPKVIDMHLANGASKSPTYILATMGEFCKSNKTTYTSFLLAEKVGNDLVMNELVGVLLPYQLPPDYENFETWVLSSGGLMACYARAPNKGWCAGCFYISNPILGEEVKVPSSFRWPAKSKSNNYLLTSWGFGYSAVSKEYKIIKIHETDKAESEVFWGEIYTLGVDESWRRLSSRVLCPATGFEPVECDGTLFWRTFTSVYEDGPEFLLSFDLQDETFQTWQGPPISLRNQRSSRLSEVRNMGDTIGYLEETKYRDIDLWVLRDKVNETWIKERNVNLDLIFNTVHDRTLETSESWSMHDVFNVIPRLDRLITRIFGFCIMKVKDHDCRILSNMSERCFLFYHLLSILTPHIASLVSPSKIMRKLKSKSKPLTSSA